MSLGNNQVIQVPPTPRGWKGWPPLLPALVLGHDTKATCWELIQALTGIEKLAPTGPGDEPQTRWQSGPGPVVSKRSHTRDVPQEACGQAGLQISPGVGLTHCRVTRAPEPVADMGTWEAWPSPQGPWSQHTQGPGSPKSMEQMCGATSSHGPHRGP